MSETKKPTKVERIQEWQDRFNRIERGELTSENAVWADRTAVDFVKYQNMELYEFIDELIQDDREADIFNLGLRVGQVGVWAFAVKDDIIQYGAESTLLNIMHFQGYFSLLEKMIKKLSEVNVE